MPSVSAAPERVLPDPSRTSPNPPPIQHDGRHEPSRQFIDQMADGDEIHVEPAQQNATTFAALRAMAEHRVLARLNRVHEDANDKLIGTLLPLMKSVIFGGAAAHTFWRVIITKDLNPLRFGAAIFLSYVTRHSIHELTAAYAQWVRAHELEQQTVDLIDRTLMQRRQDT